MTYDKLMDEIMESSEQDWVTHRNYSHWVYKHNLAISIDRDFERDRKVDQKEFAWLDRLSATAGVLRYYQLKYNGVFVDKFALVEVNGVLMPPTLRYEPYEEKGGAAVNSKTYKVARLLGFATAKIMDEYMDQAKIHII